MCEVIVCFLFFIKKKKQNAEHVNIKISNPNNNVWK